MLELRHLRLVKAIAELGSMRQAADALHYSQPALSRQLTSIEQRIGTPLFHRAARMRLTEAGEEVLALANSVLRQVSWSEARLDELSKGLGGTIRISTECNTCYQWLPERLEKLAESFPKVRVRILVDATPNPLPWILDGQLDLAVVSSEPEDERLALYPMFTDELVAVASPQHHWADTPVLSARDFAGENLLVYNAPLEANRFYQRILAPASVRPKEVTHLPLTEAMVEMVRSGQGVAVLASWSVQRWIDAGALRAYRITPAGFTRSWQAARLAAMPAPAYLDKFIDLLTRMPSATAAQVEQAPARRRRG